MEGKGVRNRLRNRLVAGRKGGSSAKGVAVNAKGCQFCQQEMRRTLARVTRRWIIIWEWGRVDPLPASLRRAERRCRRCEGLNRPVLAYSKSWRG